MKSLKDIITKTWNFLKTEQTNLAVMALAAGALWLGAETFRQGISDTKKFNSELNRAKREGIEHRITHHGTYLREEYVERTGKGALQIKDQHGEYSTVANNYQKNTLPLSLAGASLALLFALNEIKKRKSPFFPEYDFNENLLDKTIKAGVIASGIAMTQYYANNVETAYALLYGGLLSGGAYIYADLVFEDYVLKKRYKTLKANEQHGNPIYRHMRIKEIHQQADKQLKQKKGNPWVLALEAIQYLREIPSEHRVFLGSSWNIGKRFSFFWHHLLAVLSPSSENGLNLIFSGARQFKQDFHLDLEQIASSARQEQLSEILLLDYEYTIDKDKRADKAAALYRHLEEMDRVQPLGVETNRLVNLLWCGKLGLQYASKQAKRQEIEQEILQTEEIRKAFMGEHYIKVPDISILLTSKEVPELKDIAMVWLSYIRGKTLTQSLQEAEDLSQQESLLEKATIANAKTANYGINPEVEDVKSKINHDIQENASLCEYLTREEIQELCNASKVLVKYAPKFNPVYDRDGRPDNILFAEDEETLSLEQRTIVLLDHEARKRSDMMYMLVKLIESGKIIPYNEQGYALRNRLIEKHMQTIGIQLTPELKEIAQAHYYASVAVKAFSYHYFSQQKRGTEQARENFMENGISAIDVIFKHYKELYSSNELSSLKFVQDCMRKAIGLIQ